MPYPWSLGAFLKAADLNAAIAACVQKALT